MKVLKYVLVLIALFLWVTILAKDLGQKDGILHDKTLVHRHWES